MTLTSNKPKNILYIPSATSGTGIAGGEVYLLSVMRHLDRNLYNPIVLLPGDEGGFRAALNELDVHSIVLKFNYGWLKQDRAWYTFLSGISDRINKIGEIIDEYHIDLVHTNSNIFLEGALAARLKGIRHILIVHIPFLENQPIFQRLRLSPSSFASLINDISDHIIAVSEPTAETLRPYVPDTNLTVINVGLELDIYKKAANKQTSNIRSELNLKENTPLVVAVGRIHPDKGFDVLIEAAALVIEKRPDVSFLVLGSKDVIDYYKQLEARLLALNIQGNFIFLDFRSDVPEVLSQCDIFALTSVSEGGPYVLLEAIICRCAVVATKCGGIVEKVIKDRDSGLLIEVGDFQSLANNILMLLNDSELSSHLCDKAYEIVTGNFEAKQSINELMVVYNKVLVNPVNTSGTYAIDFFKQAAGEYGHLGLRLEELYERFTRVENLANKVLNNQIYNFFKKFTHLGKLIQVNRSGNTKLTRSYKSIRVINDD
jgi:glycosyltransferase involved in cell wall biosynthesis